MASGVRPGRKSSSKSGVGVKTRVIIVLLGFVVVAIGVIARRTFGINVATELRKLENQRDAVAAARIKAETEIRDASSRARLVPVAEKRLHMYVPADSQVIILPRKPE
jgi:cell division protein FtsL